MSNLSDIEKALKERKKAKDDAYNNAISLINSLPDERMKAQLFSFLNKEHNINDLPTVLTELNKITNAS